MSYTALYRKFRPTTFEDVKGQDAIVTTLKNQIKTGRIGHAYLFCGTRGTGKTTIAKIFAKAVNCENTVDGNPCGECALCQNIASGAGMNVIEIDAASNNGVDNIREIIDEVSYSPTEGKYKVYIIDEVHMLSAGAFNALLKTLEEPPSYVIFILATTEVHKIPITILSRCQRYDFKRISIDTIAARIQELVETEGVTIDEKAIRHIAKAADGSMRDALSLLDQCIAFHYGEELTYEMTLDVLGAVDNSVFATLLESILKQDVIGAIRILEEIVVQGRELMQFVTDFTWYLRNLMLVKVSENAEDALEVSHDTLVVLKEEAKQIELNSIIRYIRIFSELSGQLRYAAQKRILLEVAIIKLCRPQMETKNDALVERIRVVEDKIENGMVAVTPSQEGNAQAASTQPKPQLLKAVPEEIRKIVAQWSSIKDTIGQPMKSYLSKTRLSIGGDNVLLVVAEDYLSEQYLKRDENKERLCKELEDCIGKEIVVDVRAMDAGRRFEDVYVDLSKMLGVEVEVEEDGEF